MVDPMWAGPYPLSRMAALGGAGWIAVAVALTAAGAARADIFVHRDANGVVHLTNVPADRMAQRVLRESAAGVRPVEGASIPRIEVGRPVARPSVALRYAPDSASYDDLLRDACDRFGVDFALAKAIIRAESAFDPFAVSAKGAQGLMQLMPETARMQGVAHVFRPADNIEGGVRHLRQLLDRYRGNVVLAVAAYNAGGGRVDAAGGIPAIAETREYVRRVLRYRAEYRREDAGALARR